MAKRAKKQAERAALLESLRSDGHISSVDAARVADRLDIELSPASDAGGLKNTPDILIDCPTDNPADDPALQAVELYAGTEARRKRSRPLDDHDKKIILQYLGDGYNRAFACREAGVDYVRFRKELLNNDDFAGAVKLAENSTEGSCLAILYEQAIEYRDVGAACQFIRLRQQSRSTAFTKKLQAAEFALKKRVVEKELGQTQAETRVDFRSIFTPEEFNEYDSIMDDISQGVAVTDERMLIYAKYQARVLKYEAEVAARGPQGMGPASMNFVMSASDAGRLKS